MNVVFIFSLDALFLMDVPVTGADVFEKFSHSACVIPSYVLKEMKSMRFKRRSERVRAQKLILTIQDVCEFTNGERLGAGSKTFVSYHDGVREFLPSTGAHSGECGTIISPKRFPRVTRESKTVAIARYLQNKYCRSRIVIISGKQGLHKLAVENDVTAIYPDEAEEFQKHGCVKKKKEKRFRRHAVGCGIFGKFV